MDNMMLSNKVEWFDRTQRSWPQCTIVEDDPITHESTRCVFAAPFAIIQGLDKRASVDACQFHVLDLIHTALEDGITFRVECRK